MAANNTDVVYAGFMRRFGAFIIDSIILGGAFYMVLFVVAIVVAIAAPAADVDGDALGMLIVVVYLGAALLYYVAAALYYALQESSRHQATLGKRALGIKVTDERGQRLGTQRAFGRWFAAALSYITFYVGFLVAAFTARKQALHDFAANTLVVDQFAFTDTPERQQRNVGLAAVIVAVAMVFILVAILGILAAIAIPAYNDYTQRAKVMQGVESATPLKVQVADFVADTGSCPGNGEGGIGPADSYSSARVAEIVTGTLDESGRCAIEITLRDDRPDPLDGQRIWLEYEAADGAWSCSSELADRYLPSTCRG